MYSHRMKHYFLLNKYFLSLLLLYSSISLTNVIGQTDPSKPNILLIIADDMGVDVMNGYQNNARMPNTPHLDAFRASGVTFMNAWAAPKCTPTRATVMSGLYGIKTGVQGTPGNLNSSYTSVFSALAIQTNNAYADALIGKWHIGQGADYDHPATHGIDYYAGSFGAMVTDYYNWEKVHNDGTTSMETEYATVNLTNEAINWVNVQNQPWFLWLAHVAPHTPFHIPPDTMYTSSQTSSNLQKSITMIEALDHDIGRLMDNIPSDVLDNTIVIFMGDNGSAKGVVQSFPSDHAKGTIYQGGAHVPLVVSGPGVTRQNETENALVHATDLYATILELTGGDLDGGVNNSHSFKHLLSSTTGSTRTHNYTEIDDDWTIRDVQYKLLQFSDGSQEFYDLIADTLEATNLLNTLSTEQSTIKTSLEIEAAQIRSSWSCQDAIQNGDETGVDCGGSQCSNCADACSEETIIIASEISVDTNVYAISYIESAQPLNANIALFQAGNSVVLKPGFEYAVQDGLLEIKIGECSETDDGIGDDECPNSNTTSYTNIGCCATPAITGTYTETVNADIRSISSNNFPNHNYCYNRPAQAPSPVNYSFTLDATPSVSNTTYPVVSETGRPQRDFGVALNGVIFAPAPATPFIFENTETGEYNWDWVFEPTNNQGSGSDKVALDCSSAHTGPQGYHYHGNPFQYIEEIIQANLSTTNTPPAEPVQIGWAADGFPVLYRFGPDANGSMTELSPSYQLKAGNRPGDGISAPCGSYNGKYTNDYEYISGSGDLDECNGVDRMITLTTAQGPETFSHFYIISATFPQIPRCLVGAPSSTFDNFSGDGPLSEYFNKNIEKAIPQLAEKMDLGINSPTNVLSTLDLQLLPNPTSNNVLLSFNAQKGGYYYVNLFNYQGQKLQQPFNKKINTNERINTTLFLDNYPTGVYILQLNCNGVVSTYKIIKA